MTSCGTGITRRALLFLSGLAICSLDGSRVMYHKPKDFELATEGSEQESTRKVLETWGAPIMFVIFGKQVRSHYLAESVPNTPDIRHLEGFTTQIGLRTSEEPKAGYDYPTIRLPHTFSKLAGLWRLSSVCATNLCLPDFLASCTLMRCAMPGHRKRL
jgi:hypothetical protein